MKHNQDTVEGRTEDSKERAADRLKIAVRNGRFDGNMQIHIANQILILLCNYGHKTTHGILATLVDLEMDNLPFDDWQEQLPDRRLEVLSELTQTHLTPRRVIKCSRSGKSKPKIHAW